MEDTENQEVVWSSPEFHKVERSARWYLISLGIALALAIFALFQGNILFLLFVVIGEVIILFTTKQHPRSYTYELSDDGVLVDDRLAYIYTELAAFAIADDKINQHVELVLRPKKKYSQYRKILVPRDIIEEVYRVFDARLAEFNYEESFFEVIMKMIGI